MSVQRESPVVSHHLCVRANGLFNWLRTVPPSRLARPARRSLLVFIIFLPYVMSQCRATNSFTKREALVKTRRHD